MLSVKLKKLSQGYILKDRNQDGKIHEKVSQRKYYSFKKNLFNIIWLQINAEVTLENFDTLYLNKFATIQPCTENLQDLRMLTAQFLMVPTSKFLTSN